MRISKEVSGNAQIRSEQSRQGRGEYELCENHGELTPRDLFDRRMLLQLPDDQSVNMWINAKLQGGKRRIRIIKGDAPVRPIHAHRQVAAILLMPEATRSEPAWGEGTPVMRTGQYGIVDLELLDVRLEGEDSVHIAISELHIANQYQQDTINFHQRFSDVQRVWREKSRFDDTIGDLLQQHQTMVSSGNPIGVEAERIVRQLQRYVAEISNDYGILGNAPTTDVLPSFLQILGSIITGPPQDLEAVPQEEVEIRRRQVKEWRRWAVSRGAESARFRKAVRDAYNATCVVCGVHFPATQSNRNPGVDAAHILPWSQYDVDHVSNGLCLCKQHHWAFDESLIGISFENGIYSVSINDEAVKQIEVECPNFSLGFLRDHAGPIPEHRLPKDHAFRPGPQFLADSIQPF